jgi:FAD/FMN-containing dehydrogenase
LTALALYPLEQAPQVLRCYDEFVSSAPDEVIVYSALATLPGGGPPVAAVAACYNGNEPAGQALLNALSGFGRPIDFRIEPMSYTQVQHRLDAFTPDAFHWYGTGHMLQGISEDAASAMLECYQRRSSPHNLMIFQQLGNAANRVPSEATAFGHRDARYSMTILAGWQDPSESDVHCAWGRAVREELAPYATGGVYVNEIGREGEDGPERIRSAYGTNYARLVELKRKYDPGNLFRHNQNIDPAG